MEKSDILFFVAAATTAISGILHLMLGPNSLGFNPNQSILFIVGGIAQVFWIIPVVRRWGVPWYCLGLGGTLIFIAIYFITRIPDNPITGRGGRINYMGAATEFFQIVFVGLLVAIIIYETKKRKSSGSKSQSLNKNKKSVSILVGVVASLIVLGLFVLPMTLEQPGGGQPRGQGGSGGPSQGGPMQEQNQISQSESIPKTSP
jgi:hypothetical protein